jgi:hypothetical protein
MTQGCILYLSMLTEQFVSLFSFLVAEMTQFVSDERPYLISFRNRPYLM